MRRKKVSELSFEQRLTMSPTETANMLGICRSGVYSLIKTGRLEVVKLGNRTGVTTRSIRALLPAEAA
jgi:excisionase family DNA binding protein